MSVATASMRSHISNNSPQGKQNMSTSNMDYVASKKRKEESYQSMPPKSDDVSEVSASSPQNDGKVMPPLNNGTSRSSPQQSNSASLVANGNMNGNNSSSPYNAMNNFSSGPQYPSTITSMGANAATSNMQGQQANMDTNGPLPNEIFELLNEFWRPNEMVAPSDTHVINGGGKFSRRSPEGSLDGTIEEEKGKRIKP